MTRRVAAFVQFWALGSLFVGLGAPAEEIVLRPRYSPGDTYALSLSAVTNTDVHSRGGRDKSFEEDVELRYEARVVILETDGTGAPVRERHEGVDLTFERPGESGSLFVEGTQYEVRREGDGAVQIFVGGERADHKIEKIVAELLENQFEYTVGALVDPGRPVKVGESWQLDRSRVEDFLRTRGVRGAEPGEPATATLEQAPRDGDEGQLAIRYRIPIASFELREMPANSQTARSEGSLEGEIQLASDALRPMLHSSKLSLRMNGAVYAPGTAQAFPWTLRRSQSLAQSTLPVKNELASTF